MPPARATVTQPGIWLAAGLLVALIIVSTLAWRLSSDSGGQRSAAASAVHEARTAAHIARSDRAITAGQAIAPANVLARHTWLSMADMNTAISVREDLTNAARTLTGALGHCPSTGLCASLALRQGGMRGQMDAMLLDTAAVHLADGECQQAVGRIGIAAIELGTLSRDWVNDALHQPSSLALVRSDVVGLRRWSSATSSLSGLDLCRQPAPGTALAPISFPIAPL